MKTNRVVIEKIEKTITNNIVSDNKLLNLQYEITIKNGVVTQVRLFTTDKRGNRNFIFCHSGMPVDFSTLYYYLNLIRKICDCLHLELNKLEDKLNGI